MVLSTNLRVLVILKRRTHIRSTNIWTGKQIRPNAFCELFETDVSPAHGSMLFQDLAGLEPPALPPQAGSTGHVEGKLSAGRVPRSFGGLGWFGDTGPRVLVHVSICQSSILGTNF